MKIYIRQRYELFEKLRKFDTTIDLYVLIFGNPALNSDQNEEICSRMHSILDSLNSNASIKTM